MRIQHRRRTTALAAAALLPFALAACGSDDSGGERGGTGENETETGEAERDADTAAEPFGPACESFPDDGPGSLASLAEQPVVTAAGNSEELITLVTAADATGLTGTLNEADALTVFAPVNDAFAEVPREGLEELLTDEDALRDVVTYHIVEERLEPADLADGAFTTMQGGELTTEGSDEEYTVNDDTTVVCGNVRTANATVYFVDRVLMP